MMIETSWLLESCLVLVFNIYHQIHDITITNHRWCRPIAMSYLRKIDTLDGIFIQVVFHFLIYVSIFVINNLVAFRLGKLIGILRQVIFFKITSTLCELLHEVLKVSHFELIIYSNRLLA